MRHRFGRMQNRTALLVAAVASTMLVPIASSLANGFESDSGSRPARPISKLRLRSDNWLSTGAVVFHLAKASPWGGKACTNQWTPSMSDVQLVESAISKEHPDFLRGHHRLYAGACVRRHRVLRGRVSPFKVFDSRTGALLPGFVEIVTLSQLHRREKPWDVVDGTCWIEAGGGQPTKVSLHCSLA